MSLSPKGMDSEIYALAASENRLSDSTVSCKTRVSPVDKLTQDSYGSWKTWKVMEFCNFISRPGKSWNWSVGCGKSWKSNTLTENEEAKKKIKSWKNNKRVRKPVLIPVYIINSSTHFIRHNVGKYLKL